MQTQLFRAITAEDHDVSIANLRYPEKIKFFAG